MDLISLDLESFRIGPGAIAPKPVCMTLAGPCIWCGGRGFEEREGHLAEPCGVCDAQTPRHVALVSNGDPGWQDTIRNVVQGAAEGRHEIVGANIAGFDWPVLHEHFPDLVSLLWEAVERGAVHDVQIREKLLNLATVGEVDHYYTPDGQQRDLSYSLSSLAAKYLGKDREQEKGDGSNRATQDIWRLHFDTLDGVPSDKYPVEAADYAKHDASDTLAVFEAQESCAADLRSRGAVFPAGPPFDGAPFDPFKTESLHVAAKFALQLMTITGIKVDPVETARIRAAVERELAPERIGLLVRSGILTPAEQARPYKNGARNADGSPKMVPAEPSHTSKKLLVALVERVTREENARRQVIGDTEIDLKRTPPSTTFPEGQISVDGEVIADLSAFDLVLAEYDHYSSLQKLVSLEIPRLEEALAGGGTIHPSFEELKRTGRTSSRKSRFYPSINIQQIPRGFEVEQPDGRKVRIEPRHAYVAREGCVLCSVDYSFLELVTAAQKVYTVTGASVLRDKINAGADPHAWLGAQIARSVDPDFAEACVSLGATSPDEVYGLFWGLDKGEPEERKFYKKFRTLAKPTGLGFPGGLGHRTFIGYAKKQYGIRIESEEQAKMLREIWFSAFPEFRAYFKWVERDCKEGEDDDRRAFGYFSPFGMYRAKCSYTACANGAALQCPAGEGAKIAVFHVTRACFDPAMRSVLLGCRPLAFVHDEMIVELPEGRAHEAAWEISRIMVESMREVCPDMVVKAEPALMRRWDKGAEMVVDGSGRLAVWESKK